MSMETWRVLVQHGRVRELRKIFGKHIADLIRRERAQKVTKVENPDGQRVPG